MRTGSKIRLAREAVGLTQRELADRCGVAFSTLLKIEQGVIKEPKLADVVAIAQSLGGTCADFVADNIPEPSPSTPGRPTPPPTTKRKRK